MMQHLAFRVTPDDARRIASLCRALPAAPTRSQIAREALRRGLATLERLTETAKEDDALIREDSARAAEG